jgi:hypothetical protein
VPRILSSIVALALLLAAPCARAEVLIYYGSLLRLSTRDSPPTQKRKVYVVVDQNQKQFAILSWGKTVLGKHHDFPQPTSIDFLQFPSDDGLEDGYAFTTSQPTFDGPSGGGYSSMFLHGTEVPVIVSVSGTLKNVQPRAKTLIGTNASAATTFLGAYYNYDSFTVKYAQQLTVEANGGGSSVAIALAHLVGLVEAMGYSSE